MITETIRKRPWVIILIWIIIAAMATPLSAKLNNVVETETTSFLPEHVESIKASKQLSELQGNNTQNTAEPSFMILVHGVPVSLDTYYKLKPAYRDINTTNFQVFSWIDLVGMVEENLTTGMTQALNGTIQAINSTLQINQAYNKTREALNMTALMIAGIDKGYTGAIQGLRQLHETLPQLQDAQQALISSCNDILPAITFTYYNIVRTEALLENLTTAYQTGNLTQQDIAIVLSNSNLTAQGIPPLDPQLVAFVFQQTLLNGGPVNFNNQLASEMAGEITWQAIQSTLPPQEINQTMTIFNITQQVFEQAVTIQPDHRQAILSAPDLATGQLQLYQALLTTDDQIRPVLTEALITGISTSLPEEATQLLNMTLTTTLNLGCTNQSAPQALRNALQQYISYMGFPGDPSELAEQVITGDINNTMILQTVIQTAIQEINTTSTNLTELLPILQQMILTYDPNATGTLTDENQALATAAIMLLVKQGLPIQQAEQIVSNTPLTLHDLTFTILNETLGLMAGEKAQTLLETLDQAELLGVPEQNLLNAMPQLMTPMLMSRANITQDQAQAIAALAISVYQGQTPMVNAVEQLVNNTLKQIFPSIIEPLKGLLIEANQSGFIISLQPKHDNLDQNVEAAKTIKEQLTQQLKSLGYTDSKLLLGGNDYMVYEMRHAAQKDIERSDRLSMIFVIIVLAILLESLAAIFLPFIGIGMGLILGMASAYLLANAGIIDVTTHSRTIMFTTGLGLGIDYAVYVSKRFREAVAEGFHHRDAAAHAFSMSWRPVIAGATTASIGFGSMLLATDFPFISSIGSAAPLTIIGVMLVSITFIPALLAYVGEKKWFWWPRSPHTGKGVKKSRFHRPGKFVTSRPLILIGIVILITIGAAAVMTSFQGSYDMALNLPRDSESAESLHLLNTQYDAGILYPVLIVASDPQTAVQVNHSVSQLQCVGRTEVLDGYQGRVVRAIMNVQPLSHEGIECVKEIRNVAHNIDQESLVGGMSSVNLDLSILINNIFYHKVYPVAIVLMFITLLVAYGGLASAITAVLSVVLAAYWGSALTVYVYQNIIGEDVLWYLPVIVFTAILGVGMDYNSFYLARAREECEQMCSPKGVLSSIEKGTPTVIGLATIMAGAYAGLALTSSPGLSQMGLTLVVGVLLAGLNASLILTPPVIAYLKEHAWWPKKPVKRE